MIFHIHCIFSDNDIIKEIQVNWNNEEPYDMLKISIR